MMATLRLLAITLAWLGTSFAENAQNFVDVDTRIIGGQSAQSQRYAYAQISINKGGKASCGGSLVASDMVLTAAHCIDGDLLEIQINRYNLSDANEMFETFAPINATVHPQYNLYMDRFDVALIKLDGRSILVDTIRINDDDSVPSLGEDLTVVGWGAIYVGEYDTVYPELLQEVEIGYIPNQKCRQMKDEWGRTIEEYLTNDMMCAGEIGLDSCYGDSGSPLILKRGPYRHQDIQVGLVSWGLECAGPIPGVYSRLSTSYSWIRDHVCENSEYAPAYFGCDTPSPTIAPTEVPAVDETKGTRGSRPTIETNLVGGTSDSEASKADVSEAKGRFAFMRFELGWIIFSLLLW